MRTAQQGFICIPEEEAELRSPAYQAEQVRALAIGLRRYFSRSPPPAQSRLLMRPLMRPLMRQS